jgi:hypothetical protein
MRYVKFLGTFGSGKTATTREICRQLTGKSCDDWQRVSLDSMLSIHKCKCGRYSAMGAYRADLRCCGVDKISSQKGFAYAERLHDNLPKMTSDTVFEEGVMTMSKTIQVKLRNMLDYYGVYLDYTKERSRYQVEVLRQGHVKEVHLVSKMRCAKSLYEVLPEAKRIRITEGSLPEVAKSIINFLGLVPCNCEVEHV